MTPRRAIACMLVAAMLLAGGCGEQAGEQSRAAPARHEPSDAMPAIQQIQRLARDRDTRRATKGVRALRGVGLAEAVAVVERRRSAGR